MTFMVRVLTMPSAAISTATAASASNSPKIRPERVADGALDPVERHDLEGELVGHALERLVGGRRRAGREPDGEDVRAGHAEMVGRIGPADEHRLAGLARDGPLDDADDAQVEGRAVGRRRRSASARR